jgi:two-component system sensor histidine kinase KdpD
VAQDATQVPYAVPSATGSEAVTGLPVVSAGLSVGRQIAGALVVICGLPALTAVLVQDRDAHALATPMLLVLLVVVLGSLLGGLRVGLPAAFAGALVLNWFFTHPYGTLLVYRPDQLLVLAVYLAVSVAVSLVVGVAARRTAEATRAKAEAQALSALAGAALAELGTLPGVLEQIRVLLGLREVVLVEYQDNGWLPVETVGGPQPTPGDAELRLEVTPTLALVVRGPTLSEEDQRVLRSFAYAAATALEGRRLALRAAAATRFEAADQMRTALLAAVGHDLRTPLTGVKAAVSSLRQRDVAWTTEEMEQLLETIEDGADRLQYLVSNLLDASRLQAGVVSAAIEPVPLEEVLDRALVTTASPTRIDIDIPQALPDVLVDIGLAERVLANILDNALRNSPANSQVRVRGTTQADRVVCEVIDHGPGVPEHRWQQMFEPFQHVDDRQPGGIGLGLAVARGFTHAMGGTLRPTHTTGGGLTMQLLLPAAKPDAG